MMTARIARCGSCNIRHDICPTCELPMVASRYVHEGSTVCRCEDGDYCYACEGSGVASSAAAGFACSRLTGMIDDHLVEMTLSTALAYGSYLAAQSLHASGALACVTAGFIHGSYGRQVGMSENTWQRLDDLWEYLGFLANGVLFLLVGFSVSLASLSAQGWPVLVAILAVLAARVLVIVGSGLALSRSSVGFGPAERTVLSWAGLRGALTITLALALPSHTPTRDLLIAMAFGVVLFTLLVQGLTLPLLLTRLNLTR